MLGDEAAMILLVRNDDLLCLHYVFYNILDMCELHMTCVYYWRRAAFLRYDNTLRASEIDCFLDNC